MASTEFAQNVFLTDAEFEALFGDDVAKAIRALSKYAGDICRECGGDCCQRIRCELFSERFDSCPIYTYRPAKCRLYHCDRILESESLTIAERDLLNRPAVDASSHLKRNWGLQIFIEPPLTVGSVSWLSHLGLETEVNTIMRSLNMGKTIPEVAGARLTSLIERYREERRTNYSRRSQDQ